MLGGPRPAPIRWSVDVNRQGERGRRSMADTPGPTRRSLLGDLRSPRVVRVLAALAGFVLIIVAVVALIAVIAQAMVATGASRSPGESTALAIAHVALIGSVILAIVGIVRYGGEGFLASTWVFFPLVPPLAAAISVVGYLVSPEDPTLPGAPQDPVAAVYIGLASSILLWLLSAFPGAQLARRQRAQRRAYDDLCQRYLVLSARVKAESGKADAPTKDSQSYKALSEAELILDTVKDQLFDPEGEGPAL